MNLADKYRPRIFEDVLSQEHPIATLVAQLRRDLPLPILLVGPPGVGKTTLAFIVARALNCDAPLPTGSPCLKCERCEDFDTANRVWFCLELNAGRLGGKDDAAYVDEVARMPPFGGAHRRLIFADEAHAFSHPAQDHLLEVLELPNTAAFVLATNQPERLKPALLSRCVRVELSQLSEATLIAHGRAVCGLESIAFEPDALAMIAAASQGQARDFLNKLGEVAVCGPVTAAAASSVLDLAWADVALSSLTLLLRSGYAAAEEKLKGWRAFPAMKARALRDALAFVAQRRFAVPGFPGAVHAAFLGASATAVDELAAAIAARAAELGVAPAQCAVGWGVFWSTCAPTVHEDGDLTLRLLEFAWRSCPPEMPLPALPEPTVLPVMTARRRAVVCSAARPSSAATSVNARGAWLTKREALGVYRAATLLPQAHGVWFNARLMLRYADYDVTDVAEALRLFSSLTHELGMRVRDWVGDPAVRLHWLAQHESDGGGGLETRLLLHVPPALFERARGWLAEDCLPVPAGALVNELGPDVWRAANTAKPHVTHWAMVRELWRIVNLAVLDIDERGRRVPLAELLGIQPQRPRTPSALPLRVRRFSTSHTLGSSVWRAASTDRFAFVSAFEERAWNALDDGWEAAEHAHRLTESEERKRAIDVLNAQLPRGVSAAQDAVLDERLRTLREAWSIDPLSRARSRPLWR